MPSSERLSRFQLARLILIQEIRGLLAAPALWIMLIIVSLLVGYSFIQAVELFSQASRTAKSFPELASGMNPMEGIFVPTFGAYYLTETLLLPFVAIRIIGLDKQSGALKLLLQLRLPPLSLCGIKLAAMGIVWLLSLLPALLVLVFWHHLGGHIYPPEIAVLFAGHGLYSLAVVTIAMFAATISDSLPTAAMICLAVTLGSWVLDFAAGGQNGALEILGSLSLTGMLRQFEGGLLSTTLIAAFLSLSLLFFLLTAIWLHPGRRSAFKLRNSLMVLLALGGLLAGASLAPRYVDLTENRKHSFNPADARALRQLDKTLTITIHLDPQDSRFLDLEHDLLAKLKRCVPKLELHYAATGSTGLFSAAKIDNYGLIEYEYNGRQDQSYSNSQNEILSIIYHLAGMRVTSEPVPIYRGYPLVADARSNRWWFYLILPLFFLGIGIPGCRGKW